jgi:aryl-alcohol dehydrogenase-like predicted oxidoreductase
MDEVCSRRKFLKNAAHLTGSAMIAAGLANESFDASRIKLPRRRLGRTGVEVSIIGMGLASLGMAHYPVKEFQSAVEAALDDGINYFDTQPNYGDTEQYLATIAHRHRDRLFVVTKTWEKSKTSVLTSIRGSLDRLGLDRVDAVLLNNIGGYDMEQVLGKDGALAGLKEAQRQGQVRYFGLSGHYRPEHFARALESGEFDIVMAPFNFVDRFIYTFEQEILPVAAKHDVGVVAMKTFGGAVGLKYDTREQRAMLSRDEHELAIRYVLSLPGMCSAVIGCKNVAEARLAARLGREYRRLADTELASLEARGKELALRWGTRYPEG